jgi:two-component system CheB/CheR fusion protein
VSKKKSVSRSPKKTSFTVVAIGASVGGLHAFSDLLRHLPIDTGMAFIYVQHLNPKHKSILTEILSRTTKMKVQEIDEMEFMKPDNVYVIPHDKGIKVTDGHIKLVPRIKKGATTSIDILFSSLAMTHKKNVIGIVLSGNAHDGTEGLRTIKEAGGITFAQDNSAQAKSMPKSAIAAGVVDYILSPEEIALKLAHISEKGPAKYNEKRIRESGTEAVDLGLKNIFNLLLKKKGVDFNHYKMASIKRRMGHRMSQAGLKTVKGYEKLLLKNNGEVSALFKDLLINVTSFFRNPEIFRYLKLSFLPKLLDSKSEGETLRIWIPACSTGEEAYSIGMLIIELQDARKKRIPVQIFATDLSENAINTARIGEYAQSQMKHFSKTRLKRFFTRMGNRYRVIKELREMCVFAPHNILADPPFSKIDFISCRNLLIYFDSAAQKKALGTMNFSLNEGGHLLLGKSESIGSSSQIYNQVTNKFKLYNRKKNTGIRKIPELVHGSPGMILKNKSITHLPAKKTSTNTSELDRAIDNALLSDHMPASVVINKDMEIIQFRGNASLYLTHPQGKASLSIFKMMRAEFAMELRSAIQLAVKTKQRVHKSGIEIKIDSIARVMSLNVCPLRIEWDEPLFLIVFEFREQIVKFIENEKERKNGSSLKDLKIKKLIQELNNARTEMQAVIESQEAAYEELQVANEEIVSTSEEFQTLNEELETSKEEIEASNEELISTNEELHMRNELLTESYNYSEAIIETIHEPMIVLDEKLHVKSASKSFYKKFNTHKEVTEGVSLFELGNGQWNIPKLHELLQHVLSKNTDFDSFEVSHTFPGMGKKVMLLNAHRILQKNHRERLILLAIDDVTEVHGNFNKQKELMARDLRIHQKDKEELERAVKRRARQLQLKNTELGNANKDLTSFTYVSSHDLQEPLRKIQNFITCIQIDEEEKLSESARVYFGRIKDTASRMQLLIEDLLAYSRAKGKQNFEDAELNEVFDSVITEFKEAFDTKKATIEVLALGKARIIPFQFRQLIHNLISNSLKFSKPGRMTHIRVRERIIKAGKSSNKKLSAKKNYLNIIFTDNGIGFKPEYEERIFEVFQRLHSFDEYNGTGIGLAICKRIAENHNGIITATGSENKGARFDIYLPIE